MGLLQVLDRLGTLHLVRHTLLKHMTHPDTTFSLGPAYAATLRPFKVQRLLVVTTDVTREIV